MPLADVSSGPTALRMVEWALYYASIGIRVFPCEGKAPKSDRGHLDATTDETLILAYWGRWPQANIGGVPGPHFIVLDLDGPEGMASAVSMGIFPPRTAFVLTGGGGWHLWFRHPGGRIGNASPFHKIDVRADAGYVILPPSIHPRTQQRYLWDQLTSVLELPQGVLEQILGRRRAGGTPAALPELITAGQRNRTLVTLAGALRRVGAPYNILIAALQGINTKWVRPPLRVDEVEQIAKSVQRYPEQGPRRGFGSPRGRRSWGRS